MAYKLLNRNSMKLFAPWTSPIFIVAHNRCQNAVPTKMLLCTDQYASGRLNGNGVIASVRQCTRLYARHFFNLSALLQRLSLSSSSKFAESTRRR